MNGSMGIMDGDIPHHAASQGYFDLFQNVLGDAVTSGVAENGRDNRLGMGFPQDLSPIGILGRGTVTAKQRACQHTEQGSLGIGERNRLGHMRGLSPFFWHIAFCRLPLWEQSASMESYALPMRTPSSSKT
jgi:hypothetical protein